MKARARIGRREGVVAVAMLATHIAACSSWQAEPAAPEQLLHKEAPDPAFCSWEAGMAGVAALQHALRRQIARLA